MTHTVALFLLVPPPDKNAKTQIENISNEETIKGKKCQSRNTTNTSQKS